MADVQAQPQDAQNQDADQVMAYCVKCKAKKPMKDAQQIQMKNGRPATTGTCPDCGTKMFKIGGAKKE